MPGQGASRLVAGEGELWATSRHDLASNARPTVAAGVGVGREGYARMAAADSPSRSMLNGRCYCETPMQSLRLIRHGPDRRDA